MPAPVNPAHPEHSVFVTVLAWAIICISALLSVISGISLLMILAQSYGTASVTAAGFFTTVLMPPMALVAGIALLWRRAWARHAVLVLLGIVILIQVSTLLNRRPEATVTTSASGVTTTVMASEPDYFSLPILLVCALVMLKLGSRALRTEFGVPDTPGESRGSIMGTTNSSDRPTPAPAAEPAAQRGWRVRHQGRDNIIYEESRGKDWQGIIIEGEMLTGQAHHVLYFASAASWSAYPEWARDRREEIIGRIKSEFHPPDYVYQEGPASSAVPLHAPAAPIARRAATLEVTPSQRRALLLAIVLMLGISGGMGWLVKHGLDTGSTWSPAKRASQQRTILKADEPATFWFAITLYSALGLGAAGAAVWLIRR